MAGLIDVGINQRDQANAAFNQVAQQETDRANFNRRMNAEEKAGRWNAAGQGVGLSMVAGNKGLLGNSAKPNGASGASQKPVDNPDSFDYPESGMTPGDSSQALDPVSDASEIGGDIGNAVGETIASPFNLAGSGLSSLGNLTNISQLGDAGASLSGFGGDIASGAADAGAFIGDAIASLF
jgi:hypothetical protein